MPGTDSDSTGRVVSRRCSLGCESWPDLTAFETCPACGEDTKRYWDIEPLDQVSAQRLKNDLNFEDYYERRCHERGIVADGPLPETYAIARALTYDNLPGPPCDSSSTP